MRSIEEQMNEIRRRKTVYSEHKKIHKLTAYATCTSLILIGIMLFAPTVTGSIGEGAVSIYGATILGPEAGGYVLVAILSFTLGIVITLLIQHKRNLKEGTKR